MAVQQFCLRWNNHQPNFISVFSNLLNNESLVDVTLAAEGRHLQAHKVILSACSSYFQSLFMANPCQHPIVILKDVNFIDLKTMVDFMYYGEVNVSQEQLPHILKTAEMLKIKGLAEMPDTTLLSKSHSTSSDKTDLLKLGESNYSTEIQRQSMSPSPCSLSPSARRKRLRKTSLGSGSGSTEQTSEEHPNEISVSSPGDSGVSTVTTKMELNTSFTLDGNTSRHTTIKQHSSTDSDTIRSTPKQQSMEHEHDQHNISHISLQISQPDMTTPQHSDNQLVGVPGPSVPASTSHPASQGPWTLVEHPSYPCFTLSSCQTDMQGLQSQCMQYMPGMAPSCAMEEIKVAPASPCPSVCPSPCSSPKVQQQQPTVKRKRSVNPQADENFTKALDAVRFGGIGFCKAARMYGVNNRTLWLEYKKRGYPISRTSIKARVKQQTQTEMDSPVEQQQQPICATAPPLVTDIIGGFMNQRHVEFVPDVQRSPVLEKSIGTKRGRFLPRQSRLKKDCDQVSPERELPVMHLLSAPMKVERQFSDPSPGLLSTSNTSTIVKQHSHPFLSSHSEQSHIHAPYYSSLSTEGGRATSPIALDTIQTLRVRTDDLKHISPDTPVNSPRSSHCPAVRPGPALGCNYCWNTIDNHGRILRRKTKYHCPECQTNLCIVPCFQEYHERQTRSAELDENFSTKSKNVSI